MFIDIHGHAVQEPVCPDPYTGTQLISTPEVLIARYDEVGIERAVILPLLNPDNTHVMQSNEEVLRMAENFSGRFIPFCNLDPRALYNSCHSPLDKVLAYYRGKGCKGIGEVTANLSILDPRVQNLFHAAEVNGLPLTFHLAPFEGNIYGLVDNAGLPGLEMSLQRFPKLRFLGHSQTFWAEISAGPTLNNRLGYPAGPVSEEGAVPRLMRTYENLCGDLSAGSGCNALKRDPEYAVKFLNEFQDRLFFGTDICRPTKLDTPLVDFLLDLRREGKISETVFRKVARENAIRLLGL